MKIKEKSENLKNIEFQKFETELKLYQEIYNLDVVTKEIPVTEEYFAYCKTKENFVILVLYDKNGKVYLKECGENQFSLLAGTVLQNEGIRDTTKRIIEQIDNEQIIEELEPIAISKNIFEYNSTKIEHIGLAIMVRVGIKKDNNKDIMFYKINKQILEHINQFSDKQILEIFQERFNNIILYNNSEFQDEEIEINKKYKNRYKFHNDFVKKYILTSKRKKKDILIELMSDKVRGCSKLLDVSCGDNSLLFSLNYDENFEFIVANDISWGQVELIERKENVFFTNHNAITFPFKDNAFDMVYCSNTLHHIPNETNLVNLLNSLLRVGKKVIIYEIEDPKETGGFPYYLNKYWYRGFLKDAGEEDLQFNKFKEIIENTYKGKAIINFSNFKNIQGNYMISEIKKN